MTCSELRAVPYHQMDAFVVRRRGPFHWKVMWIAASDGIERDAVPGQRFWRQNTALRVQGALQSTMLNSFWQAGVHPLQHGAVPVAAVGAPVAAGAPVPAPGD